MNTAPKDVNADNAVNLWAYMYLKPKKKRKGRERLDDICINIK